MSKYRKGAACHTDPTLRPLVGEQSPGSPSLKDAPGPLAPLRLSPATLCPLCRYVLAALSLCSRPSYFVVMLSAARLASRHVARVSTRSLSSVPNNDNLFRDALSAVDSISSGSTASFQGTPKAVVLHPQPVTPLAEQSSVVLIPPEEDPLLHYLTSAIQHHGERKKAARIVSRTLLLIHTLTRAPPLPIVREAILAASPATRCISQKHGSKTMYKPIALGEKQRTRFAVDWILKSLKGRKEHRLEERLARELINIVQQAGDENPSCQALLKRNELHKLAMLNRCVLLLLFLLSGDFKGDHRANISLR